MPLGVEVLIDQETLRRIVLSSLDYYTHHISPHTIPPKMTKLFPNSPGNYHRPTSGYDQKTITIIVISAEVYLKLREGIKVSNGAKIRNRYNQVPHLTQDTNGKVTNSQKTPQTRAKRSALSQQVTKKHI